MYRISYNRVNIVHLCVDEKFRGQHVAIELIDTLKTLSTSFRGIRLKCRNDYNASSFWEKVNFIPIKEIPGRSNKRFPLTIWWFENLQNDLFSQLFTHERTQKILVSLDTNVFIDLKEEREEESLALTNDWLDEEIELCVTKEIFNEINRNESSEIRDQCRKFVQNFPVLDFNEQKFKAIIKSIRSNFKQNSHRDKSDLKQIVNSIIGGADYFLTRDEYWISQSKFFEKNYNLTILRPAVFITEIDERKESSKYQPNKLGGTDITTELLTSSSINNIINTVYNSSNNPQEKKSDFKKRLHGLLSDPKENTIFSIKENSKEVLGFIAVNLSEKGVLNIPFFRTAKNPLKSTLIKHLLYKIVEIAIEKDSNTIFINDGYLCSETIDILNTSSFFQIDRSWVKINLRGIYELADIKKRLLALRTSNNIVIAALNKITPIVDDLIKDFNNDNCYRLEKLLYPVKIVELDIQCFIIPIKLEWASLLFEERLLEERLNFFGTKRHIILNRQNVYYRSAKPKRIESPSRILWYISGEKSHQGFISAASYVDKIEINNPKELFKKYENLGIYEWSDISKLVNGNTGKDIMAFLFSDTVLFKNKISLRKIKEIFRSDEGKEFNPVSPVKISKNLYLKLHKKGIEL